MLLLLSVLILTLAAIYAGLMLLFARGFRRVVHTPAPPRQTHPPFVSVIVPARNEEDVMQRCLHSLLNTTYPPGRFEVIVVDDFSEDATVERVRHVQRKHRVAAGHSADDPTGQPLRLVRMEEQAAANTGHKHAALEAGIAAARGNFILTTDADCTVGPEWITLMMRRMTDNTAFVAGPVLYETGRSAFGDMQALESLGLVAMGAGAIGVGHPNMCNSANVAYRRQVYEELKPEGTDPLSAGADEVLIQRIASETDWNVSFCSDPAAAVHAAPTTNVAAFLRQRRRWAATGADYPEWRARTTVGTIYLFYALLAAGLAAFAFNPSLAPVLAGALAVKVFSEAALLIPACRHFERSGLLRYFLPEQLLQIPYVVGVGLAALFGPVYWKGRRIH